MFYISFYLHFELNFHPFKIISSFLTIRNIFHLSTDRTSFIGKSLLKTMTIFGVFNFKSLELYFELINCPSLIPSNISYGISSVLRLRETLKRNLSLQDKFCLDEINPRSLVFFTRSKLTTFYCRKMTQYIFGKMSYLHSLHYH